jgi:hypothetical protein
MKFFVFIFFSVVTLLSAGEIVGNVSLVDGNVKVKSENSIKKTKAIIGLEIHSGDLISSSKNAHIKLTLIDKSVLILDELSTLHFYSIKHAQQLEGNILYKITSRDAKNSLKVETPFAIIGIKGTTFIVNTTDDKKAISLKEGLIGIESIKEEFKLYRKEMNEAFNKFKDSQDIEAKKQQDLSDFEKFKKGVKDTKTTKIEPELTNSFDLKAGNSVSFDANIVKESSLDTQVEDEFNYFENIFSSTK